MKPSLKRLQAAFGVEPGKKCRAILEGRGLPAENDQSYYNPPTLTERTMDALNDALDGFGVESIEGRGGFIASYVNMGETYETTILYNELTDTFLIVSWGDWVERNERRYGIQ